MLGDIQRCVRQERLLYTRHARREMESEEFGEIRENEVFEALIRGSIIESYPGDDPYPSCLVYGKTVAGRPLPMVCAYAVGDDTVIVVTVYQPHPDRWVDCDRRVK